jgi:hypothetical protein
MYTSVNLVLRVAYLPCASGGRLCCIRNVCGVHVSKTSAGEVHVPCHTVTLFIITVIRVSQDRADNAACCELLLTRIAVSHFSLKDIPF